jgi:carbon starvation protein
MCLESLVAIMALIAACTLDPGVYLSMNVKGEAVATVAKVTSLGFPVTTEQMDHLANEMGEKTLYGRTGGAATLAVGMAHIFSKAVNGRWLDLWYHFAIMFEALFILTTLDAGTRVGRYLLQDVLGNIWKPLGETKRLSANVLASVLIVSGWGYFLIQGVRDPLGGINSLWPLFGIANQMLAAIALCLATTILLKMGLVGTMESKVQPPSSKALRRSGSPKSKVRTPAVALITLVPLIWLLAVTMTAGVQKIFHSDPRIGFLAQAKTLDEKRPSLEYALSAAKTAADAQGSQAAENALRTNRMQRFNNLLDAVVAGVFLALVASIVFLSAREWILLLARRKLARLRESEPRWLPEYAIVEGKPLQLAGMLALGFALAKELSGEAHLERAQVANLCKCSDIDHGLSEGKSQRPKNGEQLYLQVTEERFKGVQRCC